MSTSVSIKGLVEFAPNRGVIVSPDLRHRSCVEIHQLLNLAFAHINNQWLKQACHAGNGPLANLGVLTFEDFLVKVRAADIQHHTASIKKSLIKQRREEIAVNRPDLCLGLINKGIPYVCAHHGCDINTDLTLDHVIPVSRGGSDDLDNLQFMCRPHNSRKGDR